MRRKEYKRFNGAAAFQPRNYKNHIEMQAVFQLQWGRGISAAEFAVMRRYVIIPFLKLQWGRGISAAEFI